MKSPARRGGEDMVHAQYVSSQVTRHSLLVCKSAGARGGEGAHDKGSIPRFIQLTFIYSLCPLSCFRRRVNLPSNLSRGSLVERAFLYFESEKNTSLFEPCFTLMKTTYKARVSIIKP